MKRLLPFFCLLLLLMSCKKDDDPTPCGGSETRRINPALQDFLFAESSRWIYQNTMDSSFDTVTQLAIVKSINSYLEPGGTGNMTGGCPLRIDEESFAATFKSSRNGNFQQFFSRGIISQNDLVGTLLYSCTGQVGETFQNATVEAIYDSLTIGNETFAPVTEMLVRPQTSSVRYRYFLSPNVGIVRKEALGVDTTYSTSELVDWAVSRYPYQ